MINKNNKLLKDKSSLLIILIFSIVYLLLISKATLKMSTDDGWNLELLQKMNYFNAVKYRCTTWSSRIFIEVVMLFVFKLHISVWRICSTFCLTSLLLGIYKFCDLDKTQHRHESLILAMSSIFVLPFAVISNSVFWVTGSFNYLWPISTGIWVLNYIKHRIDVSHNNIFTLIGIIFLSFFACSHEQLALILFCFCLFIIAYKIWFKKNIDYYLIILCSCMLSSILFFVFSPLISHRYVAELHWYPGYENLSLSYKTIQSILWSLNSFVNAYFELNTIIPVTMLLITGITFVLSITASQKSTLNYVLAILPFSYFLIRALFEPMFGYRIINYDLREFEPDGLGASFDYQRGVICCISSLYVYPHNNKYFYKFKRFTSKIRRNNFIYWRFLFQCYSWVFSNNVYQYI